VARDSRDGQGGRAIVVVGGGRHLRVQGEAIMGGVKAMYTYIGVMTSSGLGAGWDQNYCFPSLQGPHFLALQEQGMRHNRSNGVLGKKYKGVIRTRININTTYPLPTPNYKRPEMGIIVSCLTGIVACLGACVMGIIGTIADCLECIVSGTFPSNVMTPKIF
jgi:hypothetical protein